MLAAIQGVAHSLVGHRPAHFCIREFYTWFPTYLAGSASPGFPAVGRIKEFSAGEECAVVLIRKINRTFPWVFPRKNDRLLPCRATVLRPGDHKARTGCPGIADRPAKALIQKKEFCEFAVEVAAEALDFSSHLAAMDRLPATTSVLRSHDALAAGHKADLGRREAVVASMLGHGPDIFPFLSIHPQKFMVPGSGVLDGPS